MVIADLDVIQLDFRGDNVDCWMEIQHGKGPWAPPVSGIVPLGSTLTLVVAINDFRGERIELRGEIQSLDIFIQTEYLDWNLIQTQFWMMFILIRTSLVDTKPSSSPHPPPRH